MKHLIDLFLTPSRLILSPDDLAETLRWKSTLDRQWAYEWRDLDVIDAGRREPIRVQR
jgi:hypothetical protein